MLAGGAAGAGLPWYAILCLPILFAAGMSLLDSIDGSFMNFAYGWAFSKPVRKVFYNITITGLSVAVALVIGTIELAGLLASQLDLSGSFWSWFENIDINLLGFVIVGLFVATWAIALSVWRFGRIEERWTAHLDDTERAGAVSTCGGAGCAASATLLRGFVAVSTGPHQRRGSMLQPAIAATALVLAASSGHHRHPFIGLLLLVIIIGGIVYYLLRRRRLARERQNAQR